MPKSPIIKEVQELLIGVGEEIAVDGFDGPATQAIVARHGGVRNLVLKDRPVGVPTTQAESPPRDPVGRQDILHLDYARKEEGVAEGEDDARIVEYSQIAGTPVKSSKAAWCAFFANAMLSLAGKEVTGSGLARDFTGYGEDITRDELTEGDIVVYDEHVAFVDNISPGGEVHVIGGNQSNKVCVGKIAWYGDPIAYRRVRRVMGKVAVG